MLGYRASPLFQAWGDSRPCVSVVPGYLTGEPVETHGRASLSCRDTLLADLLRRTAVRLYLTSQASRTSQASLAGRASLTGKNL